jgi:hypothetical protein
MPTANPPFRAYARQRIQFALYRNDRALNSIIRSQQGRQSAVTSAFSEELKPSADDLLFFVDDTGHETFAGNQGYYGLGGCAVLGTHYGHLKAEWVKVRAAINGGPDAPLHAVDMPRDPENFAALSQFFLDPSFVRIAATTTKQSNCRSTCTHACRFWVS